MFKSLYIYLTAFILVSFGFSQVDYTTEIQNIFNSNCTSCHVSGHSSGLDLTSYSTTTSGSVIDAYDYANSVLWQKVNSGTMPPSGADLNSTQINLIAQWIDEGAFEQKAGCLDEDAYNCGDSMDGDYSKYVQVFHYDFTCDGTTPAGDEDCSEGEYCRGYYNPTAVVNNGICYYPQAPSRCETEFTVDTGLITLDWSKFD